MKTNKLITKTKALTILFFTFNLIINAQNKPTTIYLVGDSTMCLYDENRFPQMGWGMPFEYFFEKTVQIKNHAKGGRSSRSFIKENRWQPILDSLQAGDYVFIQFGHNDAQNSKDHPDRKTTPDQYKQYITKYINEARLKYAIPVLISPVTRWIFNSEGEALECHEPYLNALKEVSETLNIPMIDLDTKSRELLNKMGPECSRYLYMYFKPKEYFRFPKGNPDNTHFTGFGARKMAELVLQGIMEQELELANHIIKP
ncbi:rhamnogalacturonan acetylesterase [Aestuariibaculum sediminum]|uniref:Rhamnogalacturonan acetylesterase n=1 Tax=Aestuariibaculum sediminum TaxID=2770637 RepID=A0A8J6Q178_9FLAO|nr:rhamnogalacturonan acetylesterase [Aestuariibaculum sediminum]MBD0830839.1 rhamnogalacturonan acetylesterase [Aestuariibaculum sediminum]